MAIIPSIPGVQAEVKVNGERVEEYADSSQCYEDNSTVKYIEAVSGARFTIHCKVWHPYDIQGRDIGAKIWADGESISSNTLSHTDYEAKKGELELEEAFCVRQGKPTVTSMVFAELDSDENNTDISSSKLKERIAYAGNIRIQLEKGRLTVVSPIDCDSGDSDFTLEGIGKIPEDDLKGRFLSHQVKLQEYESTEKYERTEKYEICNFVPDEESTIATFIFKYRSKSALQAEGIIPRTPSPTPLEDRPLEELSKEELRELLRRHRELDAAAAAVKREFKYEDIDGNNKTGMDLPQSDDIEITTVRPVKRRCISGPDEVIDLTGG